ncbi:type II toxin-antitoxin system VapC family toxin [Aquibium sp. ELW1220]|uniref:type II toxin-antitoxin system VapC family toxin n=1 Tax=Aquibium sp. ELW1220 TaxID=2976766 RepID=UPI0025B154BF|nr:type II toxin-antitoxin system VapC family toxin [Aquibium sp. ELW1220]MDN2581990.1 type II toxin-antitoxin system VapC family toxin [Aquibium sp. ELW1220]
MMLYLLDTNAVSMAVHRRSSALDRRMDQIGGDAIAISSITYGEIVYGLEWKAEARRLARSMGDFLREIMVLPWTEATGDLYGKLRADMRRSGISLRPLDLLIAAHALEAGATLVTGDAAFRHVPGLAVEDWTAP